MNAKKNFFSQHQQLILIVVTILICAFFVSSSYRGISHDEGIGSFRKAAERIVTHQPLLDIKDNIGTFKNPSRLIYILFIALGIKIFGFTLLAFHAFPYLIEIINPVLFFLIARRYSQSLWWGFAGALLFIFHPFSVVFLNQQHNHPFFLCFLFLMLMMFDDAVKHPKWLLLFGVLAALLILTRFEDGLIFVGLLYGVYGMARWNAGIPWKWLLASAGAAMVTMGVFTVLFRFPILYPFYYIPQLLQRQESYGSGETSFQLTLRAARYFLYWYFCGKLFAPFLGILIGLGAYVQLKKRIFQPIILFLPYFLFLLFIYNGRVDIINLPVTTFTLPGFLLLLIGGLQAVCAYIEKRYSDLLPQKYVALLMLLILFGAFGNATYSLAIIVEDGQPASTMWRIAKYNPPLPGNPAYKESVIQLNRDEQFPVKMREEIFRAVRGNYRSWFLNVIGQYAFKNDLPERAKSAADFVYADNYESKERWERDAERLDGSCPLWSEEFPGQIGAFPLGQSGAFVYKFDFPKPIDYLIISDIHTQWGFGDATQMWTSTDGKEWTLRHNNWNVHYTKDYYYQFFDDEFDGQRSLFIKYAFHAGDNARIGNDNRGASLDEFLLAVKYKQ